MEETERNGGGGGVIKRSQSALVRSSRSSGPVNLPISKRFSTDITLSTISSTTTGEGRRGGNGSSVNGNGISATNKCNGSSNGNGVTVSSTTSATASVNRLNFSNSRGFSEPTRKSTGFNDDSDEFYDTPRQRFTMIDDFPDLIKNSSGGGGIDVVGGSSSSSSGSKKRFLSRGLTRLFRRATFLSSLGSSSSSSSSSGVYRVTTAFDGGVGGKWYSESNLSRIHLGPLEMEETSSASSTLTRMKSVGGGGSTHVNDKITTRNAQVKFAKKIRPASMYAATSSSTYSTGGGMKAAVKDLKEGEKFNEEDEMGDKENKIESIISKATKLNVEQNLEEDPPPHQRKPTEKEDVQCFSEKEEEKVKNI